MIAVLMFNILKEGCSAKFRSAILAFLREDFGLFRDLIENPIVYSLRKKRGSGEVVDIQGSLPPNLEKSHTDK